MAEKVVIGGDRVGAGKKMRTSMHGWERSTHNLSDVWRSTMGAGILYPCYKKLCTKADVFDIDIEADCRTIPTEGPLFGTYKMQIDFYEVPLRLYIALLHNNARKLGLNMSKVKVPKLNIATYTDGYNKDTNGKMHKSCLLKYLGLSGIGTATSNENFNHLISRKVNAIPALAYYDIFKNYYANHQEDKAYVISGEKENLRSIFMKTGDNSYIEYDDTKYNIQPYYQIVVKKANTDETNTLHVEYEAFNNWVFNKTPQVTSTQEVGRDIKVKLISTMGTPAHMTLQEFYDGFSIGETSAVDLELSYNSNDKIVIFEVNWENNTYLKWNGIDIYSIEFENSSIETEDIVKLNQFDLENIDTMRYNLLSFHTLGASYTIDTYGTIAPYSYLTGVLTDNITRNSLPLNGLVVKTYQNDIFNNWLNSEWIEGANGINELSKVAIVNNAFSMDALNLAEKLYNMLNRVAITKGTYQDWENVQYEKTNFLVPEWPVFVGGMSQEVAFDEVIQTAPYEGSKLGTMGGRGRVISGTQKGGHIHVKCNEACYIMGICSLTPRINYTQGNDFDLTEIDSIDDLHKPALDGIGYQDLIGERMAWWDTKIDTDYNITHRSKIGKLPAWIEYMTSVDRAYGDFAESVIDNEKSVSYMTLNRNYEMDRTNGLIKDATTYIDPAKWNYPFAYTRLDAQNFWVEIAFKTIARRKMSARLIPNV